jgi:cell division protein FtsZ
MGIGKATGENRAIDAAKAAIDSPLLEMSIDGAKGILFTIMGGSNLGMFEVNEAARIITESADTNARIIFGAVIDEDMKDEIQITVVATGFGDVPRSTQKVQATNPFRDIDAGKNAQSNQAPAKSAPAAKSIMDEQKVDNSQDADLDIPAFIRKKML